MLPPIDPLTLEQNPQFASLHQHLISQLLDRDGTTRSVASQPSRKAVDTALKGYQIHAAKTTLLRQSLACTALHPDVLPDELQELVAIIATRLNDSSCSLSSDDLDLLHDDITTFEEDLRDYIGPAISADLSGKHRLLQQIANPQPESTSTKAPRGGTQSQQPLLAQSLPSRLSNLRTLQQVDIPSASLRAGTLAAEVLAAYTALIEAIIQILERTKHGSLSRGVKARAEHIATVANAMEKKVTIMQLQSLERIYNPEVQDALLNYSRHLHDTKIRLSERERTSLQQLERYEEQGEAMREIARRFGGVLKECESVKAEIRRLGGEP